MQKTFVMVPAGSLEPGDVVAVAGTPVRDAWPLAEVNHLDDGRVELVFITKMAGGESGSRDAGVFSDQYPVALIGYVEREIARTVERWIRGEV